MDDIDELGISGVESHLRSHILKPGLCGVQAGDAAQPRHPGAHVAGRLSPQAVTDDVDPRHVQAVMALRGRGGEVRRAGVISKAGAGECHTSLVSSRGAEREGRQAYGY